MAQKKLNMEANRISFFHERTAGAPLIKVEDERSINDFIVD
jgi:hypothetical protein